MDSWIRNAMILFYLFFICRNMNNIDEFEQKLYDVVDLWDDDDIEKSLSMFFMFFIFINMSSSNRGCGT